MIACLVTKPLAWRAPVQIIATASDADCITPKAAPVAVAAKLARIAWAVLRKSRDYERQAVTA